MKKHIRYVTKESMHTFDHCKSFALDLKQKFNPKESLILSYDSITNYYMREKNMSQNGKVLKAGLGYTIGNYLIQGLNFLTIPIFARLLTTSDYGIYNTFTAYQGVLFVILGVAIHTSYKNARFKYKYESETQNSEFNFESYISATMVMIVVNSLFVLAIFNLFYPFFHNILSLNRIELDLLVLFSFGVAVIQCFNCNAALNYKYQSFLKVSFINAVGNIGLSLFLIFFVFTSNRYMGRMLGTTLTIFVISIMIVISFLRQKRPNHMKEYLHWGLNYSLPLVPHGLSQVILSQFDRIMINKMINSASAGIYSFAYNIFTILLVTYQSLDNVWAQWFYERMNEKNYAEIKRISGLYVLTLFIFTACVLLVCPELILILGSAKYADSIYCAIPIIVGGFCSFLYLIPSGVEYYYEKTKYIAVGSVAAAVLNIILNYFFIKTFGYIAAAYTTLVTYFLYFIFHFAFARKIQGFHLFNNKVIFSTIIALLILDIFTIMSVHLIIIRWLIAILLFAIYLFYEEKRFGIAGRLLKSKMHI